VYQAAPTVVLPEPATISESITSLLQARKSCRDYQGTSVSLPDLSTILYWSMSELVYDKDADDAPNNFQRRPHPSGGAKYPLEAYVVTDAHSELGTAVHHYRPDTHRLEKMKELTGVQVSALKKSYYYEFVPEIPVMIIFTYIMERNVPKYGTFGTKIALVEAGHIGQNISTIATARGVGSVMLAGGDFNSMDSLFGFDSYNESAFYTVGLGKRYV
jgi:SagB-type dehydrogenase family enzyme